MNGKSTLSREYMIYKFNLHHNTTETIKIIFMQSVKAQLITL